MRNNFQDAEKSVMTFLKTISAKSMSPSSLNRSKGRCSSSGGSDLERDDKVD